MDKNVDIGGLISETLGLLGDNAREVGLFVILLGGLNGLGLVLGYIEPNNQVANFSYGVTVNAAAGLPAFLYQLMAAVVSIVATYLLLARFLASRGQLNEGGTRIWAYVGMTILTVLGMMLGFLLLIVPGIILLVRWSASSGFLIGERQGVTDALGASWEATRGHSWPIFLAGLLLMIGLGVVSGVVIGGLSVANATMLAVLIGALVNVVSNALFLAFGIAVYHLVSDPTAETSEVFS